MLVVMVVVVVVVMVVLMSDGAMARVVWDG